VTTGRTVRLETIRCPVCDSAESQPEFQVRDRFQTIPDQLFSIVRCSRCGLLFVNPRPDGESLPAFYQNEGYDPFVSSRSKVSLKTAAYQTVRKITIRRKAGRTVTGLARGRALDIGCATGEFLVELRRRGFEPFGVEPDAKAAEFASTSHRMTVWTGSVQQVPADQGPFDLITMWHVLEHVPDLRETLSRIRGLLTDDGRLAIAVPNPLSSDAKAYGINWVAWDAPRHLYHFEPRVMLDLLQRAGFQGQRRGAVAFDAFYHCLLSEKSSAGIVRAGCRGIASYLRGVGGGEGSSELYWAVKSR
jgi:SAM-dependent methyltransferase